MEKEYLKKFLDLGGGNEQLVAYDQYNLLVPAEEGDALGFPEPLRRSRPTRSWK